MTLDDVINWLETVVDSPNWYIGQIGKPDKSIGLYNTTGAQTRIAVGGLEATGYVIKPISILVHWGRNPDIAERKAQEVYDAFFGVSGAMIGGKRVAMFKMVTPQPVNVGTDSEGVFEYVIETHIYHER
ncbi:minor capsid protein [Paenibacillus motobuensis]|uniref:minor capsid protein n=1 Tax=Paenibacillus TaxID=44249 RepID=UPI00203CD58E|nr:MULTISPECIES: minor capsid protein [Paenibacillus]MCM3041714.1 minor capsid protein [Paenibacillus lutimineralis]MCM3648818.1 minor capsid protein [Paenibacillus motobuensis]